MTTQAQAQAFHRALVAGAVRELAIMRGGTGDKRAHLTAKQYAKRQTRAKMARQSRKINRKGGR